MSIRSNIVDAIAAHIATAVSGAVIYKEPRVADSVADALYALIFVDGDASIDELSFRQWRRTYTAIGTIVRAVTNTTHQAARNQLQDDLDALEALIAANPTLGNLVQQAVFSGFAPQEHPDERRLFAPFQVACTSILRAS
jgi:hypothetical protein